jgi:hypothetical protein
MSQTDIAVNGASQGMEVTVYRTGFAAETLAESDNRPT